MGSDFNYLEPMLPGHAVPVFTEMAYAFIITVQQPHQIAFLNGGNTVARSFTFGVLGRCASRLQGVRILAQ